VLKAKTKVKDVGPKAKAKDLGSRSRPRTQKVKDETKDIKKPLPQHTLPYDKEYSMCAK